jgi:hypothetical protein
LEKKKKYVKEEMICRKCVVRGIEKKRSKAYKLHPKTIELIDRVAKDRGMTQADVINTGVKMLFSERVKIES